MNPHRAFRARRRGKTNLEPDLAEINAGDFGLADRTFVGDVPARREGKNVAIEFRWAHGENSRLGEMARPLYVADCLANRQIC